MKTVKYLIQVPNGDRCWNRGDDGMREEVCPHFSNEGGHAHCDLGFCNRDDYNGNYFKAEECAKLEEAW